MQENQPVAKEDAGGKPNASELLAIAEKLCERTASKREADVDREGSRPRRGASVDMSAVMRRVAMARAEIADRDRLAKVGLLLLTHACLKWSRPSWLARAHLPVRASNLCILKAQRLPFLVSCWNGRALLALQNAQLG